MWSDALEWVKDEIYGSLLRQNIDVNVYEKKKKLMKMAVTVHDYVIPLEDK